jgi:GT2 family glycosyltransferase
LVIEADNMLSVSVIVPTFNRRARLERMLGALDHVHHANFNFEVVVVIDGATDGTEAMLWALRPSYHLHVLAQRNGGPASARNRAIAAAQGDVLVFLDDDVIPTKGLIERHLEVHRRDPQAVVTGPMVAPPGLRQAPWLQWEAATLQKQYDAMVEGKWAPTPRQFYTANASVRRCHVVAAGGFDESFTRAEDVELAFRLADRGARFCFVPQAAVLHEPDRTFESWLRVPYEYGRHDVRMAREGGRPLILELAYREWSQRHLASRLAPRVSVGRPWRRPLVAALARLAQLRLPAALGQMQVRLCSVLFSIQYWQGIADTTGLGARVWSGLTNPAVVVSAMVSESLAAIEARR